MLNHTNLAIVHQKITQLQSKKDTIKIAKVRTRGNIHKIPELSTRGCSPWRPAAVMSMAGHNNHLH